MLIGSPSVCLEIHGTQKPDLICVFAFSKWGHPQWISPSCIIQPRAAQSLWPMAHRSLSLWVTKGEHTPCAVHAQVQDMHK